MTPERAHTNAIDRVADAMTAGAPRADFADRVMAPIYGRPRRDFVARVMAGIDAAPPPVPRRVSARIYGPAFAAGAVALVALVILWRPADVAWPVTGAPDAPRVSASLYNRDLIEIPPPARSQRAPKTAGPTTRTARALPTTPIAPTTIAAVVSVYRIEPLAAPQELAIGSIDIPKTAVAPLQSVAPIYLAELRFKKENR